jgi:hypothetical protein
MATCPGRPAGAGEHLLHPVLPHHPAGTLPWTAPMSARRPGDAAAGRRPSGPRRRSTPHGPGTANAAPSPAVWPDARAGRHTEPLQVRRDADSAMAAPWTSKACPSGHLHAADAWTPDAWTPDVRSTGWTDVPTAGLGTRTGATTGLTSVRTSSRPARTRGATRPRPVTAPGSARPLGRLRDDATGAAALTGAATGQLPPRSPGGRASAHCCPRTIYGSSVERTAKLHPLWQVRIRT